MTAVARRLLAISWDMPPQSGPRAIQVSRLLRELVHLDWHSDVVCFDSWSGRYFPDRDLAARLALPPEVRRIPVRSLEERLPVRVLWRVVPAAKRLPDEKRVWIPAAVRAARRAAAQHRYQTIVSFAQPWSDHLIGLRLHRELGLPWIAHFSDPWVQAPAGYTRLPEWQRRLWQRWERDVIASASAVVFVNRQTAEATMRNYPTEWQRKVSVVPHGFDGVRSTATTRRSVSEPLHLVYTGRFYDDTRSPATLFRAMARLATVRPLDAELRLTLVGTIVPQHRALAASLGLSKLVTFTGRLPFSESEHQAASADVLLVIDAPSDNSLFLPSKLVDYLPLGKPILGITPPRGAAADLIAALGYPVVAPDDEAAIAAALTGLLDAHRAGRLERSARHDVIAARYDVRTTAAAFRDILDACAA